MSPIWSVLVAQRRALGIAVAAALGVVWFVCGWAVQEPFPMILGALFFTPPLVVAIPPAARFLDRGLRRRAPSPTTPAVASEEGEAKPAGAGRDRPAEP